MPDTPKSLLYTATGDNGTTSLVGGQRTAKHSPRIEAYGTIDELNSHIGLLTAKLPKSPDFDPIAATLLGVQHRLFDIGAALATPSTTPTQAITAEQITEIERAIDTVDAALPPLRQFVLPGGTEAAAQAHVARTVCRRAERRVTALAESEAVDPLINRYINRLSDLLFAIARFNNVKSSSPEIFWQKDC